MNVPFPSMAYICQHLNAVITTTLIYFVRRSSRIFSHLHQDTVDQLHRKLGLQESHFPWNIQSQEISEKYSIEDWQSINGIFIPRSSAN